MGDSFQKILRRKRLSVTLLEITLFHQGEKSPSIILLNNTSTC